ncbi:IS30 family transposase, partial [Acidovorax temperans]
AHKQAIVTLVERKSGYAVLAKVSNKTADLVGQAIEDKLGPLAARVKTLTVDNGKEFANHQAIDQALGIQTYFADPYCSWQRGSNENFNGLLRQYIPKKRRMETVTDEELAMIQNRLNHRPRKRLGFKTPHEVFHASLNRVAPRT